jgi:hypothetical protein
MRTVILGLVVALACFADTLTLKSGSSVTGTFLGGDARTIRMAVGDEVKTFAISDVTTLTFGSSVQTTTSSSSSSSSASATTGTTPAASQRQTITASAQSVSVGPPVASSGTEVPVGSNLVIRMIDDVDSMRDTVGQTFRASLDEPVLVDGRTVIPRGIDVTVKLIEDKQSGRLTGRTELTLDIVSITANGKTVDVATAEVTQQSESRTGQTAKTAGGLAAVGAIIGGIAGGGRGAAIGAAAGGATGAGVQVLTKGARVKIPSETRLTFTLQQPIRL